MRAGAVVTQGAPRGWHRPVKPGGLLVVGGLVLLLWLVVLVSGVWYFYQHWEARIALRDQAITLRLPEGMRSIARISEPVHTRLDLRPTLAVPLRQTIAVHVSDPLLAKVRLQAVVPVSTEVTVTQVVPVHTTLDTDVVLRSWLPTLHVSLPVTFNLPVHMQVPVRAQVPVDLDVLISGELKRDLNVPLDTTLMLRPHVQGALSARLDSETGFRLLSPLQPIPLRLARADLRVPFTLAVVAPKQP